MAFSNFLTFMMLDAVNSNNSNNSNKSKSKNAPASSPASTEPELMSDEMIKLLDQIKELKKHMEEEKTNINNKTGNINSEYSILRKLEERLQELLNLLSRAQNTETEYNKIKMDVERIKNDLNRCNTNLSGFKTTILDSTAKLSKSLTDFDILNKKYNELKPTQTLYNAQLDIDRFEINNLSREISELKAQIITLENILKADKLKIQALNENIDVLNSKIGALILEIYSNIVYNNQNILKLNETIHADFNQLFTHLKKQNGDSDIFYEKIMYRDIEHEKLYNINKALNVLFYCVFFAFILIMISTGNINREKFLIYLFVGLIPVIYPFLFKMGTYLLKYLSNDSHGPKNAFIDINNTIYGPNILI